MWGGEPAQAEKLPQVDGGLVASREPLPGVLDWLRFHHEAHLSGFLPQGQLGGGGCGGAGGGVVGVTIPAAAASPRRLLGWEGPG